MNVAHRCRRRADQAFRIAVNAIDAKAAEYWAGLADEWTRLAERAEAQAGQSCGATVAVISLPCSDRADPRRADRAPATFGSAEAGYGC